MSDDTSKVARIRETADGFMVSDFHSWPILGVYANDADAGERARDLGYEDIIWEGVDAEVEYRNLYKEIDDLMAEAGQLIDEYALGILEDAAGKPTREEVGDMKHIRQLVGQLVAFLSSDGE